MLCFSGSEVFCTECFKKRRLSQCFKPKEPEYKSSYNYDMYLLLIFGLHLFLANISYELIFENTVLNEVSYPHQRKRNATSSGLVMKFKN